MRIVGIDPGSTESAFVELVDGQIASIAKIDNETMLELFESVDGNSNIDCVYIEEVVSYGMPIGQTTIQTIEWIGQFKRHFRSQEILVIGIPRKEVCKHICNHGGAKDANIRQALIDRYPATGGGAIPQIGTKKQPGPLYGISKDIWSALAIVLTGTERQGA